MRKFEANHTGGIYAKERGYMGRTLLILMMAFAVPTTAVAQTPSAPYAGQQTRDIKALSEQDIASLLKGEGMGLAKAAELNGYPGPAHVLALAKELMLTDEQKQQVQAIFDQMHTRALALGKEIVERERVLDQRFAKREVTTVDVAAETAKIASLQGQLRSVHLAAHLQTRPLLNPHQFTLYQRLRGYGDPTGAPHHHHG